MKRFCSLVVLMVLSSSAHAGNSFSFVIGGHRIHIEAPRHCRSASCVSVSIPGIYETRRGRDRDDESRRTPSAAPTRGTAAPLVSRRSKPSFNPSPRAPPRRCRPRHAPAPPTKRRRRRRPPACRHRPCTGRLTAADAPVALHAAAAAAPDRRSRRHCRRAAAERRRLSRPPLRPPPRRENLARGRRTGRHAARRLADRRQKGIGSHRAAAARRCAAMSSISPRTPRARRC